jgi:hypothetical protein
LRHRHRAVGNKRTHEALPLCDFLDVEGLLADLGEIADAAQPRAVTLAEIGLALLRRFDARRAASAFPSSCASSSARPAREARRWARTNRTRASAGGTWSRRCIARRAAPLPVVE